MTDVDDKARAQWEKFLAALPELLKTIPGKYVCYLDGVRYATDNEHDARRTAIKFYGFDAGYVIAQVVRHEPIPVQKLGGMGATAVYEQWLKESRSKYDALVDACKEMRALHETVEMDALVLIREMDLVRRRIYAALDALEKTS